MYLSQRSSGSRTCPSASITLYARAMSCPPVRGRRRGPRDLASLHVDRIAPGPHRLHGLEAALHHVAVELHAIAVRIGEVDAARDVVLHRRVDLDAHRLQLAIRRLELLEAADLPRRVVQAGVGGVGGLAARRLE